MSGDCEKKFTVMTLKQKQIELCYEEDDTHQKLGEFVYQNRKLFQVDSTPISFIIPIVTLSESTDAYQIEYINLNNFELTDNLKRYKRLSGLSPIYKKKIERFKKLVKKIKEKKEKVFLKDLFEFTKLVEQMSSRISGKKVSQKNVIYIFNGDKPITLKLYNKDLNHLSEIFGRNLYTNIVLENHEFGPAGAKEIGSFLSTNNTITSIDFAENVIGTRGAEDLFSALSTNNTLTSINLKMCDIGDEGAEALASLLKTNTSLRSINLENNRIGDEGAKALLPSSKRVSINLSGNQISPELEVEMKQIGYKMDPKYESLGVLWEGCQWCKEGPATLVLQLPDSDNVYVACENHRGDLEKEKRDKNIRTEIIDQSSYITAEDIVRYRELEAERMKKQKLSKEAAHPARIAPLYIESKGSVKNETNCMIM